MADTTGLNDAAIDTTADTGANRTIVRASPFRDTAFAFYMPDGAPYRVTIRNNEFAEDVALASISGAGAANAITAAERVALMRILKKLHIGRVHP